MAKAYEHIGYDLGLLSAKEQEAFAKAGVGLGPAWKRDEDGSLTVRELRGGRTVAFVVFPEIALGTNREPGEKVTAAIAAMCSKARQQHDLVVGISRWGYFLEMAYLRTATVMPDILLGGGPGMGFQGQLAAEGRVYWVRPYAQGKAVNKVDVLAWPDHSKDFRWNENVSIQGQNAALGDGVQDDPAVKALFDGVTLSE